MIIAFYKPYNVLSQFTGEKPEETLGAFNLPKNVYACGRLDKDSEGLLILSDESVVQHRLTDPKFEKEKTYWVQVEGIPSKEALDKFQKGLIIQDYKTKPCKVRILMEEEFKFIPERSPPIRERKTIPTTWIEVILTEGKNRQVRRMTAHVGFPTLRLIRVRAGKFTLENLQPGQWVEISITDIL